MELKNNVNWEEISLKYKHKNAELQKKEQLIRNRLECMQLVMGLDENKDSPKTIKNNKQLESSGGFFDCIRAILPGGGSSSKSNKPKPAKKVDDEERCPELVPTESDLCDCTSLNLCQEGEELLQKDDGCGCTNGEEEVKEPSIASCLCKNGEKAPPGDGSMFSIKSADLYHMQNVREMALEQRELMKQVVQLEQKEKAYGDVLRQLKNTGNETQKCPPMSPQQQCVCDSGLQESSPTELNKINAQLRLENVLLKNELKDMRIEVRQYLEKMEGPMIFKIESERYKCAQLENELVNKQKEFAELQAFFEKQLNETKMELLSANSKIYNLTNCNETLCNESKEAAQKIHELEDLLIRQKLSEAETIKTLQNALEEAKESSPKKKKCCDLFQLARDLSATIKTTENVPSDIANTSKYIKELADIVDEKQTRKASINVGEETENDDNVQSTTIEIESELTVEINANNETNIKESEVISVQISERSQKSVESEVRDNSERRPSRVSIQSDKLLIEEGNNENPCTCKEPKKEAPVEAVKIKEPPKKRPKRKCACSKSKKLKKDKQIELSQLWPKETSQNKDALEVSHRIDSRNKNVSSTTLVKCPDEIAKKFPFSVETQVDVIDKKPEGVNISTTITKSGVLEVVTEGPEGVIDTKLIYTASGNVEVVTEVLEYSKQGGTCNIKRITAPSPVSKLETEKLPAIEASPQVAPPPLCQCSVCPVTGTEHQPETKPADRKSGSNLNVTDSVKSGEKTDSRTSQTKSNENVQSSASTTIHVDGTGSKLEVEAEVKVNGNKSASSISQHTTGLSGTFDKF